MKGHGFRTSATGKLVSTRLIEKPCLICGRVFQGSANRSYCSRGCGGIASIRRGKIHERELKPVEVERILDAAVAQETAMPWEKHAVRGGA